MPTVKCYGIHSDEVGLRYLVQDTVTNAYGFSRQESFHVETPFRTRKAPHAFKITSDKKGLEHRTAWVASPVPLTKKGYISAPDEDIDVLAAFSNSHILPAWMLNTYSLGPKLLTSNITSLIITSCTPKASAILNDLQGGIETYVGKIIFHGDFYFSKRLEKLKKLPRGITKKEAKRIGLANMSNYLRGRDV